MKPSLPIGLLQSVDAMFPSPKTEYVIDSTRWDYEEELTPYEQKISSKPQHTGRGSGKIHLVVQGDCTPSAATRKKLRDKRKKRNKARK